MKPGTKKLIKNIYLYLVSFVTLMMIIIATADVVYNILGTYVFPKANDYYYKPASTMECSPTVTKTASETKQISTTDCEKTMARNKKDEEERKIGKRHQDYARDLSMLIVALPLFLVHQHFARRKED